MAQIVVNEKDTPLKLAEKYKVPVKAILKNNGITSLTPGQTLNVPNSSGGGSLANISAAGPTGQAPTSFGAQTFDQNYSGINPITGGALRLPANSNWSSSGAPGEVPTGVSTVRGSAAPHVSYRPANPYEQEGGLSTSQAGVSFSAPKPKPATQLFSSTASLPTANADPKAAQESTNQAWLDYWNGNGERPAKGSVYDPNPQTFKGFYAGGTNQVFSTLREARQFQMRNAPGDDVWETNPQLSYGVAPPTAIGNSINTALSWRVG